MNSERLNGVHDDESRRRSGAKTSDPSELERLGNRIYKTYGARREFAKRLQSRGDYWNSALVFLTSATVLGSVVLVIDIHAFGHHGDVLMVIVGVVALVASLMVAGRDYRSRSRDVFAVYRGMQRLSTEIESAVSSRRKSDDVNYAEYDKRYQDLLDSSENHSQSDYFRAHHPIWNGSKAGRSADWKQQSDVVSLVQFVSRWLSMILTIVATSLPLLLAAGAVGIAVLAVLWAVGV